MISYANHPIRTTIGPGLIQLLPVYRIKKAKRGKSSEQVASGSGGIFAKLQQSLGSASSLSSSSLAQGKGGLPSLTSASSQSQGKGLFQFSASSASGMTSDPVTGVCCHSVIHTEWSV